MSNRNVKFGRIPCVPSFLGKEEVLARFNADGGKFSSSAMIQQRVLKKVSVVIKFLDLHLALNSRKAKIAHVGDVGCIWRRKSAG